MTGPWRFWDRGEIDKSLHAFFWKDSGARGNLKFLEGQKLVSCTLVSMAEYLEGLSQDAADRR
jgi:hypothetical protein